MGLSMGAPDTQKPALTLRGLLVGVEHFPSGNIADLQYSVDDAVALHEALSPNSEIALLTDKAASRSKILDVLNQKMNQTQEGDLLLLFFSGHGLIRYNDYFFTPCDADANNLLGTCISSTLVINALAEVAQRGGKVLLILDTCHSAAISFDIHKYTGKLKGGISTLFSCSPMEFSFESYIKERKGVGAHAERGGAGYFTYYLVEGLSGHAAKGDLSQVTLRDLFDYTYAKVKAKSGNRQHPILQGTLTNDTVIKYL